MSAKRGKSDDTEMDFGFIVILVVGVFFLAPFVVEFVWNESMPDIFGLPRIDTKQAACLFALSLCLRGR